MSEVKNIGTIGQRYYDKKTEKSGVLIARDPETKRVTIQGDDETFNVSYAAFSHNWRKSAIAVVIDRVETTEKSMPETDTIATAENPETAVTEFIKSLDTKNVYEIHVSDDGKIAVNLVDEYVDRPVFVVHSTGNADYQIEMMTDLYLQATDGEFRGPHCTHTLRWDPKDALNVVVDVTNVQLSEYLENLKTIFENLTIGANEYFEQYLKEETV